MIVLSGALVLPDRVLDPGTLVIEGDRITDIRPGRPTSLHQYIVPGFVDVHVHGVDGIDSLDARGDDENPVAAMAATLPRYGVTGFCPTAVACRPPALARLLAQVRLARSEAPAGAARVLPAHLESNFINPDYRGAQPPGCLCSPRAALAPVVPGRGDDFSPADVLAEIERAHADIAIVTVAPELEGGMELLRRLVSRGLRVSLGHSGATYDQALDAIGAGARHATHLFNRMPPLGHRAPGLAGAVLSNDDVTAEIICDGYHVHPAMVHATVAAKGPSRVIAITDGTALAGLPPGTRGALGGQPIVAADAVALLADGTIAGSMLTMDRAFRNLVMDMRLSLVEASAVCSATPARELGLHGMGTLTAGAAADLVVLDERFAVVATYVAGRLAFSRH
jgi:N-acetylglucosamine-6-phosphate deacetylase